MKSIFANLFAGITPASVEKYLLLTGWTALPTFGNQKVRIFKSKEHGDIQLLVPMTEDVIDYYDRINDLVCFLSAYTESPKQEIIDSLKSAYIDRMQFRIISPSSEKGMIPLDYAARCIEGLKDLVLYAACAEENSRPVCVRVLNNAKNRLEQFQFEQTEVGSFIFNVGVQVADEENEQYTIEGAEPAIEITPEHRIVKRIETALTQIDNVANRTIKMDELVKSAYEDGITANMCDAISMLKPESGDIELETSIHYAEAITHTVSRPVISRFDNIHFSLVDEISKRYRDRTLVEDVTLTGLVVMLQKASRQAMDAEEDVENTVRLITRIDKRQRAITLHLSPEDHAIACDAYRDDKEVEVSGTIDMSGKYWFFSDITEFKMLE